MADHLPHLFEGERCVHCNRNMYDCWDDQDDICVDYPGRKTVWTFEADRNDMAEFDQDAEMQRAHEALFLAEWLPEALSAADYARVKHLPMSFLQSVYSQIWEDGVAAFYRLQH